MRRKARGCKSNGGVPRSMRSLDLVVVLIGYVGVSRTGGRHTERQHARGVTGIPTAGRGKKPDRRRQSDVAC